MLQVFQTSSKYNSTSSIQWYNWISDTPYYSPPKSRKPPKISFFTSNSSRDSLRDMFQVFQTSSKYNSTSSIQWYNWISDTLYYSPQKSRKPPKIGFFTSNSSRDSLRDMFQVFQTSSKYNSMSSIQWYNQIMYSSKHVCEKCREAVIHV
jgi:hypothetical protein